MRRYLFLIICAAMSICLSAQGLRHSVCIVQPEYTDAEKTLMGDYSLYMARAGMTSASRTLSAYKSDKVFGSGVMIEQDGRKIVLTNLHVVGYAKTAKITFQLHDKNITYPGCPIVRTGQKSDLAAIELPQECDLLPLTFSETEPTEELAIVAAGFPELAGQPSWQLSRGYISNAYLHIDEVLDTVIQHTASIDPGSSGGPLLVKTEDGKYRILGINTWKAMYREGVGLAIPYNEIRDFLSADDNADVVPAALQKVKKMTGEKWLYAFRQLPAAQQKQIKEMEWRMPLDQVLSSMKAQSKISATSSKNKKRFNASKPHIEKDMENTNGIRVVYENFFGADQQVSFQAEHDWIGYIVTGLEFKANFLKIRDKSDPTSGTISIEPIYNRHTAVLFGLYLGGQVPIAIDKYLLIPRITQSFGVGPIAGIHAIDGGYALTTDTRIGLDWHLVGKSCDFILGLHYDFNWMGTPAERSRTAFKVAPQTDKLNQYLQHGIGITVGIGW